MEQKRILRESRKYQIGSVHEIPSGQIIILDRFLKDDKVWLKFKYMEDGRVEEALEKTITTYIFKYNKTKEVRAYRELINNPGSRVVKEEIEELLYRGVPNNIKMKRMIYNNL